YATTCTHFFRLYLHLFFNATATTYISTLSLHDALPILGMQWNGPWTNTWRISIPVLKRAKPQKTRLPFPPSFIPGRYVEVLSMTTHRNCGRQTGSLPRPAGNA